MKHLNISSIFKSKRLRRKSSSANGPQNDTVDGLESTPRSCPASQVKTFDRPDFLSYSSGTPSLVESAVVQSSACISAAESIASSNSHVSSIPDHNHISELVRSETMKSTMELKSMSSVSIPLSVNIVDCILLTRSHSATIMNAKSGIDHPITDENIAEQGELDCRSEFSFGNSEKEETCPLQESEKSLGVHTLSIETKCTQLSHSCSQGSIQGSFCSSTIHRSKSCVVGGYATTMRFESDELDNHPLDKSTDYVLHSGSCPLNSTEFGKINRSCTISHQSGYADKLSSNSTVSAEKLYLSIQTEKLVKDENQKLDNSLTQTPLPPSEKSPLRAFGLDLLDQSTTNTCVVLTADSVMQSQDNDQVPRSSFIKSLGQSVSSTRHHIKDKVIKARHSISSLKTLFNKSKSDVSSQPPSTEPAIVNTKHLMTNANESYFSQTHGHSTKIHSSTLQHSQLQEELEGFFQDKQTFDLYHQITNQSTDFDAIIKKYSAKPNNE